MFLDLLKAGLPNHGLLLPFLVPNATLNPSPRVALPLGPNPLPHGILLLELAPQRHVDLWAGGASAASSLGGPIKHMHVIAALL